MEVERRVARARAWIVEALRKDGVPYQVVGGLPPGPYGAHRPPADIDVYAPLNRAASLLQEARPFVTWGPEHYADGNRNITFLQIDYRGQWTKIGDSSTNPQLRRGEGHP